MIYTSYFSNWRNFPEGAKVVGITQYPPKGWDTTKQNWTGLAPSPELLQQFKNHQINEAVFKFQYLEELEKKYGNKKQDIVNYLKHISQEHDLVLCCYEKKGDFCHRHILREWLEDSIEIAEL